MQQTQPNMTSNGSFEPRLSREVVDTRARTQETAQRMTLVALRQWEKAITGVVALPVACAVTTAAGVLFVTSLVERAFEMVDFTLGDVGLRIGDGFDPHGEARDRDHDRGGLPGSSHGPS